MSKLIIFDAGPIITLATNNLLGILSKLKDAFGGEFLITPQVKEEVISRPLESKKFKFEALQVLKELQEGVFRLTDDNDHEKTKKILDIANNTFSAQGNFIQVVHYAEIEVLSAALEYGADAVIIDERTTRVLIENPMKVRDRLQKKLHTQIDVNKANLVELKRLIGKINVLRSFELVTLAYEKDLLKEYIVEMPENKKELLDGILWGVKLHGCSVSEDEIQQVLKLEHVL